MINRRKFINTALTGLGGSCLLPATSILASEQHRQCGSPTDEAVRTFNINRRYLNFPVKVGATNHHLELLVDGKVERLFDIELSSDDPDWWAFLDVEQFKGKSVQLRTDDLSAASKHFAAILQSNELVDADNLYQERLRPQFHFTTRRGWINDPNGLVYYKGEYHLFYQLNPYGWGSAQKHWGHAVSSDLVHWKELPVALYADQRGEMYSGSAVIDWNNSAGLEQGDEKTMLAFYTTAGYSKAGEPYTQDMAFSHDRGRTWEKYQNNPIVPKITRQNRDPKVFWYAPEKKWVMALYHDTVGWPPPEGLSQEDIQKQVYENPHELFSSTDLKQWERMSEIHLAGDIECPELFEIAIDGNADNTRWIFYGANGLYLIGDFDGTTFTPESGPLPMRYGNCFYASQTFNDIPQDDGRRILIPWGVSWAGMFGLPGDAIYEGMPFNQMLGLPVALALKTTDEGLRIHAEPVEELKTLRGKPRCIKSQSLKVGDNPLADLKGELLEIEAEISPASADTVSFNLRGIEISYDTQKQELSCLEKTAPLKMVKGKLRLRMLVDRTSIDIFANDGRLYMPMGMVVPEDNHSLALTVTGGKAKLHSMTVFELKSVWPSAACSDA